MKAIIDEDVLRKDFVIRNLIEKGITSLKDNSYDEHLLANRLFEMMRRVVDFEEFYFCVVDHKKNELVFPRVRFVGQKGYIDETVTSEVTEKLTPDGLGPTTRCVNQRQIIIVNRDDPQEMRGAPFGNTAVRSASAIHLPIFEYQEQQVKAVVGLYSGKTEAFEPYIIAVLRLLCEWASICLGSKDHVEKLGIEDNNVLSNHEIIALLIVNGIREQKIKSSNMEETWRRLSLRFQSSNLGLSETRSRGSIYIDARKAEKKLGLGSNIDPKEVRDKLHNLGFVTDLQEAIESVGILRFASKIENDGAV